MLLEYADSIIAILREPFLILDKSLRIISVNRAFCAVFEVAEKDVKGRLLFDLGDGQWNIPEALGLLKEIIPEKKVVKDYEVEYVFERIGKRTMLLNACQLSAPKQTAAMIEAGARQEELILLAMEDITERKKANEETEKARRYAELLLETTPSAIFTVDINRRITGWNKKTEEIMGYSAGEMIGKECTIFAKEPCETKCGLYSGDVKKPVVARECTIKRKDGQICVISKNADLLKDEKGKIVGGIESFEDITERKKMEEALKKKIRDLEAFHKVVVGRELKMEELKARIKELEKKLGEKA